MRSLIASRREKDLAGHARALLGPPELRTLLGMEPLPPPPPPRDKEKEKEKEAELAAARAKEAEVAAAAAAAAAAAREKERAESGGSKTKGEAAKPPADPGDGKLAFCPSKGPFEAREIFSLGPSSSPSCHLSGQGRRGGPGPQPLSSLDPRLSTLDSRLGSTSLDHPSIIRPIA